MSIDLLSRLLDQILLFEEGKLDLYSLGLFAEATASALEGDIARLVSSDLFRFRESVEFIEYAVEECRVGSMSKDAVAELRAVLEKAIACM